MLLLERLLKMLKILFNKKDKQKKFLESIEGLGDILVAETQKKQRGQTIRTALNDLTEIVIKLFQLQKTNPDKFERLILDKEFFSIHEKSKREAALRLEFQPDKYLIAFSSPLYQIMRVHETAIKVDYDEISKAAVISLIRILRHISVTKNNNLFVKYVLRKILEAFHKAIKTEDPSTGEAAFEWYPEIVFNLLEGKRDNDTFNLEYLPLFNDYFVYVCKFLIEKDYFEIFKALIFSFLNGIHIPTYNRGKVWEFESVLMRENFKKYKKFDDKHEFHQKISNLDKIELISNKEKLEEHLKGLDNVKKVVSQFTLSVKGRGEIGKIYNDYRNYLIALYKYNNLLRIFFGIGAYAWFKQKTKYIKLMWEAKQPPDSDATWSGENIIPESVKELLEFFIGNSDLRHNFDFWEGHSGSEKYINEYFLLSLAKYLIPVRPNMMSGDQPSNEYTWGAVYQLPQKYDSNELSSISYVCKNLSDLAKDFKPVANTFEELNLPGNETDVMSIKASPFLLSISNTADLHLEKFVAETKISEEKVKEFREDFSKGYYSNAVFRSIFNKYSHVKHETKSESHVVNLGYNRIEDKEAFIKDWHVDYHDWGKHYGEGLATSEDTSIGDSILQILESSDQNLDDYLEEQADKRELIILVQHSSLFNLAYSKQFIPKYRIKKPLDTVGFSGYYNIDKTKIPVFEYFNSREDEKEDTVLVANIGKLGNIVQLPPMDTFDKSNLINDVFFQIISFSEDEKSRDNFINEPPPWLKEQGNAEQQTNFLNKKVLFRTQERFVVQLNRGSVCRVNFVKKVV